MSTSNSLRGPVRSGPLRPPAEPGAAAPQVLESPAMAAKAKALGAAVAAEAAGAADRAAILLMGLAQRAAEPGYRPAGKVSAQQHRCGHGGGRRARVRRGEVVDALTGAAALAAAAGYFYFHARSST